MRKRKIYQFEYNMTMGNTIYLPLASGLLRSYSKQDERIRLSYEFMPFQFVKNTAASTLKNITDFEIVAISLSMWNYHFTLSLAETLKKINPDALIIAGGPSVPFEGIDFLRKYPFVDVTIRGEGELTFKEILLAHLEKGNDFSGIKGISYRTFDGKLIRNPEEQALLDLTTIPSPYVQGEYEYLFKESDNLKYQTIIETNRGCPFNCGFCFWGQGGLSKKMRQFPIERVKADANWIAQHKIEYTFCADSNFGIFGRDVEIADYFAQIKKTTSFPEKFRVCYAKNSHDRVEAIAKIFNECNMDKSITLSFQTKNPEALKNIGRRNIRQEDFIRLQKKYSDQKIPVYSEMILGLPGETYQSFLDGIEEILQSGLHNKLFIYLCQVYPNTMIADPEYQKRHGIKTLAIPLNEIHCSIHVDDEIREEECIIVETATLSRTEWERLLVNSILIQLFFSLELLYMVMVYCQKTLHIRLIEFIDFISRNEVLSQHPDNYVAKEILKLFDFTRELEARGNGITDNRYGGIYWSPEEVAYLHLMEVDKNILIEDIYNLFSDFLVSKKTDFNRELIHGLIEYQINMLPGLNDREVSCEFKYDYSSYLTGQTEELNSLNWLGTFKPRFEFNGDTEKMARQLILFGRKSGSTRNILVKN